MLIILILRIEGDGDLKAIDKLEYVYPTADSCEAAGEALARKLSYDDPTLKTISFCQSDAAFHRP